MSQVLITRDNGQTISVKSILEIEIHENLKFRYKNFALNKVLPKLLEKKIYERYYDKFINIVYKTGKPYGRQDYAFFDLKELFGSRKIFSLEAKAGSIDYVLGSIDEEKLIPHGKCFDSDGKCLDPQIKSYTIKDRDFALRIKTLFSLKDSKNGNPESDSFGERAMNLYNAPETKFELEERKTNFFEFLFYLFVNDYQKGIYLSKGLDYEYGLLVDKEGYEKIELRYQTFLCDIGLVFEKLTENEKIDLLEFEDCKDTLSLKQFKSQEPILSESLSTKTNNGIICEFGNMKFRDDMIIEANGISYTIDSIIEKFGIPTITKEDRKLLNKKDIKIKFDGKRKTIIMGLRFMYAIMCQTQKSMNSNADDANLYEFYRDFTQAFKHKYIGTSGTEKWSTTSEFLDAKKKTSYIIKSLKLNFKVIVNHTRERTPLDQVQVFLKLN